MKFTERKLYPLYILPHTHTTALGSHSRIFTALNQVTRPSLPTPSLTKKTFILKKLSCYYKSTIKIGSILLASREVPLSFVAGLAAAWILKSVAYPGRTSKVFTDVIYENGVVGVLLVYKKIVQNNTCACYFAVHLYSPKT